ncbi:hypothetical protein GE09DRAFT_1288622 [Coniochaeta sp. 2T2.1]|nr:hypothetical protein GE09DRAFT_1288622 [Coniochaeta sp. 2T2.1]
MAPAGGTPAAKTPAKETPAQKTPAKTTSAQKASAKKTSAKKLQAVQTPAKTAPTSSIVAISAALKTNQALLGGTNPPSASKQAPAAAPKQQPALAQGQTSQPTTKPGEMVDSQHPTVVAASSMPPQEYAHIVYDGLGAYAVSEGYDVPGPYAPSSLQISQVAHAGMMSPASPQQQPQARQQFNSFGGPVSDWIQGRGDLPAGRRNTSQDLETPTRPVGNAPRNRKPVPRPQAIAGTSTIATTAKNPAGIGRNIGQIISPTKPSTPHPDDDSPKSPNFYELEPNSLPRWLRNKKFLNPGKLRAPDNSPEHQPQQQAETRRQRTNAAIDHWRVAVLDHRTLFSGIVNLMIAQKVDAEKKTAAPTEPEEEEEADDPEVPAAQEAEVARVNSELREAWEQMNEATDCRQFRAIQCARRAAKHAARRAQRPRPSRRRRARAAALRAAHSGASGSESGADTSGQSFASSTEHPVQGTDFRTTAPLYFPRTNSPPFLGWVAWDTITERYEYGNESEEEAGDDDDGVGDEELTSVPAITKQTVAFLGLDTSPVQGVGEREEKGANKSRSASTSRIVNPPPGFDGREPVTIEVTSPYIDFHLAADPYGPQSIMDLPPYEQARLRQLLTGAELKPRMSSPYEEMTPAQREFHEQSEKWQRVDNFLMQLEATRRRKPADHYPPQDYPEGSVGRSNQHPMAYNDPLQQPRPDYNTTFANPPGQPTGEMKVMVSPDGRTIWQPVLRPFVNQSDIGTKACLQQEHMQQYYPASASRSGYDPNRTPTRTTFNTTPTTTQAHIPSGRSTFPTEQELWNAKCEEELAKQRAWRQAKLNKTFYSASHYSAMTVAEQTEAQNLDRLLASYCSGMGISRQEFIREYNLFNGPWECSYVPAQGPRTMEELRRMKHGQLAEPFVNGMYRGLSLSKHEESLPDDWKRFPRQGRREERKAHPEARSFGAVGDGRKKKGEEGGERGGEGSSKVKSTYRGDDGGESSSAEMAAIQEELRRKRKQMLGYAT